MKLKKLISACLCSVLAAGSMLCPYPASLTVCTQDAYAVVADLASTAEPLLTKTGNEKAAEIYSVPLDGVDTAKLDKVVAKIECDTGYCNGCIGYKDLNGVWQQAEQETKNGTSDWTLEGIGGIRGNLQVRLWRIRNHYDKDGNELTNQPGKANLISVSLYSKNGDELKTQTVTTTTTTTTTTKATTSTQAATTTSATKATSTTTSAQATTTTSTTKATSTTTSTQTTTTTSATKATSTTTSTQATTTTSTTKATSTTTSTTASTTTTSSTPAATTTTVPLNQRVKGDANGDGDIASDDAQMVLFDAVNTLAGHASQFPAELAGIVDINQNSQIDVSDAQLILNYYTFKLGKNLHTWEELLAMLKEEGERTDIKVIDGVTYVQGLMIVNKTYALPSSYNPGGLTPETKSAFAEMQKAAFNSEGLNLYSVSDFRSYETQRILYNNYVKRDGKAAADTYSARPGHSEHQTGLAIDVNCAGDAFHNTREAKWLAENCWKYGFIVRYPLGKADKTGYKYESWHIRYVGKEWAKKIYDSGLCMEEYFNLTSEYAD